MSKLRWNPDVCRNLLFSSLNFPTAWDRWCFSFFFRRSPPPANLNFSWEIIVFASSWTIWPKCPKNGLVKGILWTASPVRSFVRCLRIQSSSHASIVHWALRLDEGCRSISALSSYEKSGVTSLFWGIVFLGFFGIQMVLRHLYTWYPKQPMSLKGCFNGMFPNLYIWEMVGSNHHFIPFPSIHFQRTWAFRDS